MTADRPSLTRAPVEPVEGLGRLALSAALTVMAIGLFGVAADVQTRLPTWVEIIAAALGAILVLVALWQFILALYEATARRVVLSMLGLLGILIATGILLKGAGGYGGIILLIGLTWLSIIFWTWPKSPIRGPRLRRENLEPPERRRAE
jgi:hypothetical protein